MKSILISFLFMILIHSGCAQEMEDNNSSGKYNKLTREEERIIIHKGTERPFTGEYDDFFEAGTYICKRCNTPLYRSEDKFHSGCGWPSFDDEIPGAVNHISDADGIRTEIVCNNCGAHLGHIFKGEGFTAKNTRHCVNSLSLSFIPAKKNIVVNSDTAIFAGGCFWGVEYYFQKEKGVISTDAGYTGGRKDEPTYREVSSHSTGHAEAVRVIFNPQKVSYEELARLFFEIHDPTQLNRQGPDIGNQYRSEIFYLNEEQRMIAEKLIGFLIKKGYKVVTKVTPATVFWVAEKYHQDYYMQNNGTPYCHLRVQRF